MAFKYTTLNNVIALLPGDKTIDEATNPNDTEVNQWIDNVEAAVDLAIIDGGGTAPTTDATQVSTLDLICAREVAWQIMVKETAVDETHPYHALFVKALETLAAGGMLSATSEAGAPWSYTMDAPSTTDASLNEYFTREKVY